MANEELQEQTTAEKLQLLKSPLIAEDRSDTTTLAPTKQATAPDLSLFGNRFEADCPQFQKVCKLRTRQNLLLTLK